MLMITAILVFPALKMLEIPKLFVGKLELMMPRTLL